jgi:anti-sigma B factor antagonist
MSTLSAPERLRLSYRLAGSVAVVALDGEIDVSTCGLLRERLLRVLTDECHQGLVLNMRGVNFIDSTGIGVLVGVWHRECASQWSLVLAAPSRQVRGVLETTGLTKILAVCDTEDDAVRACGRQPRAGAWVTRAPVSAATSPARPRTPG